MPKPREISEFDLLELYVSEMESRGENRNVFRLNVDESMASTLSRKLELQVPVQKLQALADKCLANEWLKHTSIGEKYGRLRLTAAGLGVVRSRQRKQETLSNRTLLKRFSDYIVEHKGLFIALASVIAVVGLLAKLF